MTPSLDLDARIVRYGELQPCRTAFIDAHTPGSDRKENFTIIGGGVSEAADQHVHIRETPGFNIGAAGQPPRCRNSLHSHRTAEVFFVLHGRWRFFWGRWGTAGEVVLDPFFGTGTTGAMARKLGRRFIGIEQDPVYAAMAGQRIAAIAPPADPSLVCYPGRRQAPRIPFGRVVELGLLTPGQILTDASRRIAARVAADGTLIVDGFRGSIHQVGAHVQRAAACNGWQFWWAEYEGERVPIDVFRQRLRAELQ